MSALAPREASAHSVSAKIPGTYRWPDPWKRYRPSGLDCLPGFNRHVGAVYFNQLGGMAYALSGYTNPLVVYRGDSYYGGGFALLAEAWRKTFRPHI